MDPITIGVGLAAGGAIAQYLNSDAARKANQADIDQLKGLLANLQSPNFDSSKITPEQYKVVSQYVPEVAPKIQEVAPTVIKQSADMSAGMDAQRQALQKLQQISGQETNPELQAMSQQQLQGAQNAAQSRQQSLMQQFQRQGMLNSGTQLAGQLAGNEGAMSRAAEAGQNSAMEAYRQRLSALQGSAQLGGQIRSQDQSMQSGNAAIINAFNQRMANSGQQYANYAADTANQGQLHNQNLAQTTANANVGINNDAAVRNQQYQNYLQQMQFGNQLQKLGVNANYTNMGMNQRTSAGQDQNAAIQGVTNAGVAGAMYSGAQQNNAANQQNSQQLAFFNKYGRAPNPGEYGGGPSQATRVAPDQNQNPAWADDASKHSNSGIWANNDQYGAT